MTDYVLIGRSDKFVVKEGVEFHCKYGKLKGKLKAGKKVKIGKEDFKVIEASFMDKFWKSKRMPQIVMPKDSSQVAAVTGVSNGWKCLDAGAGSGFMTMFIGNLIQPDGSLVAYERNSEFVENVKKNVEKVGLSDIVKVKHGSVADFTEKNLDLITLDCIDAEKMVTKAWRALKYGGWLMVYSPHIEQQQRLAVRIDEKKWAEVLTIETNQREWKVDSRGFTHPKPSGLIHTGFMTFMRKI